MVSHGTVSLISEINAIVPPMLDKTRRLLVEICRCTSLALFHNPVCAPHFVSLRSVIYNNSIVLVLYFQPLLLMSPCSRFQCLSNPTLSTMAAIRQRFISRCLCLDMIIDYVAALCIYLLLSNVTRDYVSRNPNSMGRFPIEAFEQRPGAPWIFLAVISVCACWRVLLPSWAAG